MGDMNGISQVVFDRVSEALFTDKKIKATYTPRYGMQGKESEFNPLGLVNRGSIIYLVATYWGYDDIKHLPLYRFGRVTVLDTPAHRPEGFDFQSYIKNGGMLKQALGEAPEQITLQVSSYLLEHLLERQPGISGSFKCDEDQGTATFRETITNEFLWWLRAMGPNVKVLEPQSLVEYLKDDLQKTLAQY
jgi:predicted DNA-binding transcriptional regulator YafY